MSHCIESSLFYTVMNIFSSISFNMVSLQHSGLHEPITDDAIVAQSVDLNSSIFDVLSICGCLTAHCGRF